LNKHCLLYDYNTQERMAIKEGHIAGKFLKLSGVWGGFSFYLQDTQCTR